MSDAQTLREPGASRADLKRDGLGQGTVGLGRCEAGSGVEVGRSIMFKDVGEPKWMDGDGGMWGVG